MIIFTFSQSYMLFVFCVSNCSAKNGKSMTNVANVTKNDSVEVKNKPYIVLPTKAPTLTINLISCAALYLKNCCNLNRTGYK